MKVELRIVIDNNMSPQLARQLGELCQYSCPTWRFLHNTELGGVRGATPDSNWIAKLNTIDPRCQWLIISKDSAKSGGKDSERLPTVAKAHKQPFVIMSDKIGSTAEQKEALAEVLKHFPNDVVAACKKLLHRKRPHVRLARITGKKGEIGYHLRVGPDTITQFLEPKKPSSESNDLPFRLE